MIKTRTRARAVARIINEAASSRYAATLAGACLVLACGATHSSNDQDSPASDAVLEDADGNRWVAVGPAEIADEADLPDTDVHRELSDTPGRPLLEMGAEELAEAMQPVTFSNGVEYRLAKPDVELARRMLAEQDTEFTSPASQRERPSFVAQQFHDADDRYPLPYNTTHMYRTVSPMWEDSSAGRATVKNCTLTLIGASTALSNAHCFHTGNSWRPVHSWAFGACSTCSQRYPYNPWDTTGQTYPSDAPLTEPIWQCYTVSVPACWANGNKREDCDYAVVEFSSNGGAFSNCNLYPGNTLGWIGWGSQSSTTVFNAEHEMKSYPVDSPCAGGSCNWPLLWGQALPWKQVGYTSLNGYSQVVHWFDTTGGASGSLLFNYAEGFPKAIGIHWGDYGSQRPNANYAVRINSSVINFVKAYSAQ